MIYIYMCVYIDDIRVQHSHSSVTDIQQINKQNMVFMYR